MTPSRVDEAEEAVRLRAKRGEAPDFGLWAQREASPEVARAVVLGAGQAARKAARPGKATSAAKVHTLALLIEAHGPLTRSEMAERTGWKKDSCNGRVAEGRALPDGHEDKMLTDGHRGGESLVHLQRLWARGEGR